jgi:hypothetical protein
MSVKADLLAIGFSLILTVFSGLLLSQHLEHPVHAGHRLPQQVREVQGQRRSGGQRPPEQKGRQRT